MENGNPVSVMGNLLRVLADGGLHSTAELARRLDISVGLVTAMTDDLVRRGYLAEMGPACGTGCAGCGTPHLRPPQVGAGVQAACHLPGTDRATPVLLALTEKGQRMPSANR